MDFGTLLHVAKKNSDSSKKESSSYYCTKYAPPKKESKEKKLSENIQKFLQNREKEELERKRQEKEKLNKLLAMRDEKSKNKIRKMLKVTKSANKSVLADAISTDAPANVADQDDYGYVSTEANSFYQKYIEKVKDVKDDKGFAPSRPQSLTDLKGTKERVKAAITREIEEKKGHRQRTSQQNNESNTKNSTSNTASVRAYTTSKTLYDPVAERQEEERKKREEEQKKAKLRKPPPPAMDFQSLLKLAEQKQHEPVQIAVEVKKPKEPERLLTSKEKKELEERKRAMERKDKDPKRSETLSKDRDRKGSISSTVPRMEPNGRIPKLNQPQTIKSDSSKVTKTGNPYTTPPTLNKNSSNFASNKSLLNPKNTNQISPNKSLKSTPSSSSSQNVKVPSTSNKPSTSLFSNKKEISCKADISSNKTPYTGPTRQFPPRDVKSIQPRQFPPPDVRRSAIINKPKQQAQKRRIIDDDDEEDYDSEMDDFIDDGEEEEDYSSHIKAIFGYDKSKYRDTDDFDDRAMESNFAQVQREEYISKKIGIQEDLEDMRQEALEKKKKIMKKKKFD